MKNTSSVSIPTFVAYIRYKDGYVLEARFAKIDALNDIDALDECSSMFHAHVKDMELYQQTQETDTFGLVYRKIFRSKSCGNWKREIKHRVIYNEQNDVFILE